MFHCKKITVYLSFVALVLFLTILSLCITYWYTHNSMIKQNADGYVTNIKSSPPVIIPHTKEMQKANLHHSYRHQQKFFSVRSVVLSWVKNNKKHRHLLYDTGKKGVLFAIIINKDYAYRHILKTGGTTVMAQTHTGKHVSQNRLGNRKLFAMVRDPMDHFLSGWAECGFQHKDAMMNLTASSDLYDDQVKAWLHVLKTGGGQDVGLMEKLRFCSPHSFPQSNFLFQSDSSIRKYSKFEWDAKLDIVGDLREMPGLLEMIGFQYQETIKNDNVASENQIKKQNFPHNISLLSVNTMQDICRYVALDYYLFDFDPPPPCREELNANIADMMRNTSVHY